MILFELPTFIFYFDKVHRTLRLFISNTTSDQSSTIEDENVFDLNNGNVPSWTLKIEGRLLDVRSIYRNFVNL